MTQGKSAKKTLVRGEVLFDKETRPFTSATVYIRLEDVGRADAASGVVAEQVVRGFSYKPGGRNKLEFKLNGEPPDPRGSYNVRVHVDVDADGEISVGDYITMESYPVLTDDYPNQVSVHVKEVT